MTLIFLAAMAPAAAWMWYFCRRDKRREPWTSLGAAFVGGAMIVFPVALLQMHILPYYPKLSPDEGFFTLLYTTTCVAGVIEEGAKLGVVLLFFMWHHDFDEPVDGLVYAIACAMGFTAAENFIRYQVGIDPSRFLNPPGHAMFAVFWGYELGQTMIKPGWGKVVLGFALSIFVHGLWDTFSIYREGSAGAAWVPYVIFPFAMLLFCLLEIRLQHAQASTIASREA